MTQTQPMPPVFLGVDVSKNTLDLGIRRSDQPNAKNPVQAYPNDPDGVGRLVERIKELKPALIVVEATGGYENLLLDAALDAGLPISRVQPGRVRHFAKAMGLLAKTDSIDADLLALYAERLLPSVTHRRTSNQIELDDLLTCRRQLIAARTVHNNQIRLVTSGRARTAHHKLVVQIDKQVKQLDDHIAKLIDSDDDLSGTCKLLESVPGVGKTTSATLAADLPELGKTDHRKIASLVGVAPFNHDSGSHKGKRAASGGRTAVRNVLYMAATSAIRWNRNMADFAKRLTDAGKPYKVVLVACIHKLLKILNAILRDNKPWNEKLVLENP